MKYLSVCSGIEAASVAWHPLGWEPVAFSEIDPFASAVLKHRFPDVPNLGDMTKYAEWNIPAFDLLVGGTPCQSFSVAGLRQGLKDPRGNLALVYLGILDKYRPRWCVWENVTGVLSSSEGRDFGAFLGALGKLGYGWSYRVLDAQYVRVESHPRAVPQRRRRVFVVGHSSGDARRAAEALLEPEGRRRDHPPRRQEQQSFAGRFASSVRSGSEEQVIDPSASASSYGFQANLGSRNGDVYEDISPTVRVNAQSAVCVNIEHALHSSGNFDLREVTQPLTQVTHPENRSDPEPGSPCHPLDHEGHAPVMAISFEPRYYLRDNKTGGKPADVAVMTASAGKAGDNAPHIAVAISNPPALCVNIEHALHATGNPYSIKLSDVSEAITRSECNMHTAVLVPTASQPALAVQEDKQNGVMLSDTSGSLRSNAPGSQPCGTLALTFGEVISFKPGQSEAAGGFFATVGFAPTLQSVNNGSTAVPVVAFPCGEHALHAMGFDAYNQKATGDVTHPLRVGLGNGNGDEIPQALIVAPTLTSANNPSRSPQSAEITQQVNAVYAATMQVRRLSPLECERLQGFPDGWTDIPYKNSKGSPDGPRYKALGNSMAVNVMRFIGERIQLVST